MNVLNKTLQGSAQLSIFDNIEHVDKFIEKLELLKIELLDNNLANFPSCFNSGLPSDEYIQFAENIQTVKEAYQLKFAKYDFFRKLNPEERLQYLVSYASSYLCERAFSTFGFVKTKWRSTMSQDLLQAIMRIALGGSSEEILEICGITLQSDIVLPDN